MQDHELSRESLNLRDQNERERREVAEKQAAHERNTGMMGAELQKQQGMAGCANERPTLRDRLKRQIKHASEEVRNAHKSNELFALLEKNPEVARILELMQEIGER